MREWATHHDRGEGGSVLIWALLFVVVTSGMIISHSMLLTAHRRDRQIRFGDEALARNFAMSGMTEALGWFHKQAVQPVQSFAPRLDPSNDPPLFETIDPTVGLVREFEIDRGLWGRYEVRDSEVTDVSAQCGGLPAGSVWQLGVRAYVFRRLDPRVPFNREPNRVFSTTTMSADIRGCPIQLPVLAAVNIDALSQLDLNGDVLIDGRSQPGVAAYDDGSLDALPVGATGAISGTPADMRSPTYDSNVVAVFGMRADQIAGLADNLLKTDTTRSDVLDARRKLLVSTAGFDESVGLDLDESILVVNGDLQLLPGSNSTIRGVLFVDGDLIVYGTAQLGVEGSLVVRGALRTLAGSTVRIALDAGLITRLSESLSRYRLPRTVKPGN